MELRLLVLVGLGLVVVVGGGCGGETSLCPGLPSAPAVLEPVIGRIDVTAQTLRITSSPFVNTVADGHAGSQFEIWLVNDAGDRRERVWTADIEQPADPAKLTAVTLADGAFEGIALPDAALSPWTDYVVRVRYRDACGAWSDWSADRRFRTDDGGNEIFDPSQIRTVYLDIPPDSMQAMEAEAVGPWPYPPQRHYQRGTLTFEGLVFDDVGVKVKGGCGSSRHTNQKAGLKISLTWDDPAVPGCPASRRLFGQTHLTLNNMVQDPTFERERLAYELFRAAGVPAPRAAHVRVVVNGEDWGLYLHLESTDRRFFARWLPSSHGMLYEGGPFCDVIPNQIPPAGGQQCWDEGFTTDECSTPSPGDDPTDWSLLEQLGDQVAALPQGQFYPGVGDFFDYDEFLTSWAVGAVIDNWDGYQYGNVNNYRVYHDPSTGLWSLIQTGLDNTFDSNPNFDFWGAPSVLAARCLQEPACKAAFAAKVAQVNDLMESLDLADEAEAIQTQIAPEVATDPRKEESAAAAAGAHANLVDFLRQRPAAVRANLAAHGF
ncbi:MAG TPA: CotH kinase family protein [Kofleriaceae bacterium]|nr:CotH kinase family protein [Kofleriaceae bacterium]